MVAVTLTVTEERLGVEHRTEYRRCHSGKKRYPPGALAWKLDSRQRGVYTSLDITGRALALEVGKKIIPGPRPGFSFCKNFFKGELTL